MNICDLKRGERAIVLKVELKPELRERLLGLSIHAGAKLTLIKASLRKKVFLVQAGASKIAVRREIAEGVRVWRI